MSICPPIDFESFSLALPLSRYPFKKSYSPVCAFIPIFSVGPPLPYGSPFLFSLPPRRNNMLGRFYLDALRKSFEFLQIPASTSFSGRFPRDFSFSCPPVAHWFGLCPLLSSLFFLYTCHYIVPFAPSRSASCGTTRSFFFLLLCMNVLHKRNIPFSTHLPFVSSAFKGDSSRGLPVDLSSLKSLLWSRGSSFFNLASPGASPSWCWLCRLSGIFLADFEKIKLPFIQGVV